jgi:DNA-nicking Smr family endonuclease
MLPDAPRPWEGRVASGGVRSSMTAVRDDDPDAPEPVALPIDGILDLHTFQPREVKSLVGDYLDECRRLGIFEVRIIHGKGTGTLRRVVHGVLEKRTDVVAFGLAPPERGGWGATLVTLAP